VIGRCNPHNSAVALGRYLLKTDPGERAYIHEVRGFGVHEMQNAERTLKPYQVVDALKTVEIIGRATKAEQYFLHGYTRIGEDERLDDPKWIRAADEQEKRLGLAGQPRIIAFHENPETGERHMHVAWSRIDSDAMKAINLSRPILKMMDVSRELEREYGLRELNTQQDREQGRKAGAAKRAEIEEARRLDIDLPATRQSIAELFQQADSGQAFKAALQEQGMQLTNGTRRDCFVVIDQEGGQHALNKKLLDMKAGAISDRLSDIDRSSLEDATTVAKRVQAERKAARGIEQEQPTAAPAPTYSREDETARQQVAELEAADRAAQQTVKQEAAARKVEREQRAAAKEPAQQEGAAHRAAARLTEPQRPLGAVEQRIHRAAQRAENGPDFAAALEAQGFMLARVTGDDVKWAQRERVIKAALIEERGEVAGRNSWMMQGALGLKLDDKHKESAARSYEQWAEARAAAGMEVFGPGSYVKYVHDKWRDEIEKGGGVEVFRAELAKRRADEAAGIAPPVLAEGVPLGARVGEIVALSEHGKAYRLDTRRTGLTPEMLARQLAHAPHQQGVKDTLEARAASERHRCVIVAGLLDTAPESAWQAQGERGVSFAREGNRAFVVSAQHAQMLTHTQENALARLIADDQRPGNAEPWQHLPELKDAQRAMRHEQQESREYSAVAYALRKSADAADGGRGFVRQLDAAGFDVVKDMGGRLHIEQQTRTGARQVELGGTVQAAAALHALHDGTQALRAIESRADRAAQREQERAQQQARRGAQRMKDDAAREAARIARAAQQMGRDATRTGRRGLDKAAAVGRAVAPVTSGAGKVLGGALGALTDLVANAGRFERQEREARPMANKEDHAPAPAQRAAEQERRNPTTTATPDVENKLRNLPQSQAEHPDIIKLRHHIESAKRQQREADQERDRERDRGRER
jgi:hypothetical protein